MTMRVDLRTRPVGSWSFRQPLVRPDCYGCADCGRWFQFARELVLHVCEARDA